MDKTKLNKMEELDAKIEKINYDLLGLESRKKEIEEKKFAKQQEIEKQEEEKKNGNQTAWRGRPENPGACIAGRFFAVRVRRLSDKNCSPDVSLKSQGVKLF